jgi:FixJ family two-component response regulator
VISPVDLRRLTVFIVDDDESICEAITNLLESVGIRAEHFGSTEDFLLSGRSAAPGCLILDVRLPGMTGVEFQQQLAHAGIHIPIIFMTAHGDIPMVRKVMKAGAVEFLTKPFQKEELLTAIHQAFEGLHARHEEQAAMRSLRKRYETLTGREREVMELVTAGLLTKQIAGQLNLSEITVKLHRRHVMEKMHAGSLADLVRMAERIKNLRTAL